MKLQKLRKPPTTMRNMLFLLSLFLLSGCVSSDRLVRHSPFNSSAEISADANTVNIWPFFLKNTQGTSILWPIADFDKNGFAIRPFFHKDQDNYGVLWPLSGWNSNSGWAFPIYWTEDNYGVFPVFYNGTNSIFFTIIYLNKTKQKISSGGVFPLVHLSHRFNYIFPAWWNYRTKNWGVFPVAGSFAKNSNYIFPVFWGRDYLYVFPFTYLSPELTYIGPVWWRKDQSNLSKYGVIPLFGVYDKWYHILNFFKFDLEKSTKTYFIPFYIYNKSKDNPYMHFLSLPFSYGTDKSGEKTWFQCLNYINIKGSDEKTHAVLPLFYYHNTTNSKYNFLTPIYSMGRDNIGDLKYVNVLMPLYTYSKDSHHIIWPLIKYKDKNDFRFWPLFIQSGGKPDIPALVNNSNNAFSIFPLYNYKRINPRSPYNNDTPLKDYFKEYNCITEEISHSAFLSFLKTTKTKHLSIPDKSIEQIVSNIKTIIYKYRKSDEIFSSKDTNNIEQSIKNSNLTIELPKNKNEAQLLLEELNQKYQVEKTGKSFNLGWTLLANYKSYGDNVHYRSLMGLNRYMKIGDSEQLYILKYFYRYTKIGEEKEWQFFPFVSINDSPKKSSWSFLWRLLEYHNDEGKTGGHIFFIPYGD